MQKKRKFKAAFTCRWAPSDGQDGKPGKDGIGIKSADVVFALSTSNTTPPSDSDGWYTLFSQLYLKEDTYVWSCTKITLTSGTSNFTGKQCLGASKDFVNVTEQYAVGNSGTTAPTSGWGTSYTPTKELWLWTRNRMQWSNGTFTYTTTICIGYFGQDGNPGKNGQYTLYDFGISAYKTASGCPSDISSSEWQSAPPTPTNRFPYVWMRIRRFDGTSTTATNTTYTRVTGEDGTNGAYTDYTFNISKNNTSANASTAPTNCSYSTWQDAPMATNTTYPYLWMRMERKNDPSNTSISYVCMTGAKGDPGGTGAEGNGIKSTEVTYQIGSSGTNPPKGTWSTSVPNITDANPYLWTRTIFKYTNGTDSKSYSVATRGTKGALMREHDGFESGKYKYLSGSGAEEYIDVVCINGKWWQCIVTYDDKTDTPSLDDGHWKEMNSFKSIATHLLLAENATINMLGTNQINLFNPSNGAMFGSFRVVDDDYDWSLWLGGKTGDSASFAVRRNGYLKATNADISGRIDATSGSVGGFNIGDNAIGTFDGSTGAGFNQSYMQFTGSDFFHGHGYFIACGNYAGKGLYIDSTVSSSNNLCAGIQVRVKAGDVTPSDPVDGGNMCTALDLFTQWTGQAGSFDMTNPYEGNHAIVIRGGDVIGLRPSFVRLAASDSLTDYHHTVECYNSSAITLTLPYSPKYGQCYTIIQRGSRVTFSSYKGIYDVRRASSATTFNSDTRGQVSWLWYNGSQWIVCYTTN